ncbi:Lysophospholipid acyltransferase [Colletotrichum tanaceti]|uniref:Lysophospholipid acyltransferase n=1 Tax=Colletotrichum tanaceti TaxID=1306861 RepID=A0A4U6XUH8_9PEZI|nr:Lysophospholipid acyltransferase [Colletotrichum tanaceti]TKW59645.1 Lysophospholipid acyltransferase [Colletotrichum tanaceti]
MLPFISKPFELLALRLGASSDELKLVFSFLISYPLAGLLKRIPDARPDQKNLFIICTSTFYLVGLFDLWDGVRTLAIASVSVYCIAKYMRTSPFMPWIGFGFLMGHMSINHIARQVANNPSSVDITGAQMVLLMKLSAFCWNVADGQLPEDQLSDYQKERRLVDLPGLLDYAGYVLFFPSLFAGPAFDYIDYRKWIDTTMFNLPAQVDPSKAPPVRKKRKIPRSGTPATLKAASGLGWIGLFMFLSNLYPITYLTSPSYMDHGFLHRIWILHMAGFTARLKYYGVWCLTEGACILAGLGYNGVDPVTGKVSWNRLQNINPWGVETAQNTRAYLGNWNMNTNNWLRNYIYLRVTPRGKKPGFRASLATFSTSALWHGFYPGYYMSFILASFIQTVAKNYRRYLRAFFIDPNSGAPTSNKIYYDILSYFVTQVGMSFAVAPFLILEFSGSVQAWARVYFYTIVGTMLSMAFFASPAKQMLKKQLEQRQGKAGAKLTRTLSQDSLSGREPVLGVSADPQREIDEAMEEIKAEVEARQRKKAT